MVLSFLSGDIIVGGDVRIEEESILIGLLNTQNVTEFANLCSLTSDTINCRGKWFTNVIIFNFLLQNIVVIFNCCVMNF